MNELCVGVTLKNLKYDWGTAYQVDLKLDLRQYMLHFQIC